MPSFHSTTVVFSVWFFKYKYIFFHSGHHYHIVGTTILSRINVDCVFLASHNNGHKHITTESGWNSLKVIFTKKFLTESSHFLVFWCIPCTATPILISSKNVNNTALVSRLSFRFLGLWFNTSCLMQILEYYSSRLNHDHVLNLCNLLAGHNLSNTYLKKYDFM